MKIIPTGGDAVIRSCGLKRCSEGLHKFLGRLSIRQEFDPIDFESGFDSTRNRPVQFKL